LKPAVEFFNAHVLLFCLPIQRFIETITFGSTHVGMGSGGGQQQIGSAVFEEEFFTAFGGAESTGHFGVDAWHGFGLGGGPEHGSSILGGLGEHGTDFLRGGGVHG
jgi:hypothetical protein